MKITVFKEKKVNIDLEEIIKNFNKIAKNTKLVIGKNEYAAKNKILNKIKSFEELSTEILDEIKDDHITIFISDKKYNDNYFFHENSQLGKYLISLSNWAKYTTYSKNTGIVYMITDILALYVDNKFRHHNDGIKKCIYNFGWKKTDIDDGIKASAICEECQNRIIEMDNDKELILNDVINLLEELKKSNSYNDIVEYWKMNKKEQVKIFFSYAHKDREYLNEFKEYIKIFERNNLVERWDDNELVVGEKWDNTIKDKIYSADIIIFLLSATSLASDYIYHNELKIAFELNDMDEAYVVPIIIKDCLWDMTEFSEFQILPIDGKAVNSWDKREEAWTSVSRGLKKAIDNIISAKQNSLGKIHILNERYGVFFTRYKEMDSDKNIVLNFLNIYSRWWFNIPRLINWGSDRDGFQRLKNISYSELEKILFELEKEDKKIQSKPSTKNENKFLYKIK